MSKRPGEEKLDLQSQKKAKLSSQEIEVSSNTQQTQSKVSPIFLICILSKQRWIHAFFLVFGVSTDTKTLSWRYSKAFYAILRK
jgi:hypothetical protein